MDRTFDTSLPSPSSRAETPQSRVTFSATSSRNSNSPSPTDTPAEKTNNSSSTTAAKRQLLSLRQQTKKSKLEVCLKTEEAAASRAEAATAEMREKKINAVKAAVELRECLKKPMTLNDLKRKFPDVYEFVFDDEDE